MAAALNAFSFAGLIGTAELLIHRNLRPQLGRDKAIQLIAGAAMT